jgi:hypothetical protein
VDAERAGRAAGVEVVAEAEQVALEALHDPHVPADGARNVVVADVADEPVVVHAGEGEQVQPADETVPEAGPDFDFAAVERLVLVEVGLVFVHADDQGRVAAARLVHRVDEAGDVVRAFPGRDEEG